MILNCNFTLIIVQDISRIDLLFIDRISNQFFVVYKEIFYNPIFLNMQSAIIKNHSLDNINSSIFLHFLHMLAPLVCYGLNPLKLANFSYFLTSYVQVLQSR